MAKLEYFQYMTHDNLPCSISTMDYRTVWLEAECIEWESSSQIKTCHVGFTSGGNIGQQASLMETGPIWIPWMREHAWPLVPWHLPKFVHTRGWQLWSQVHQQQQRQAFDHKLEDNVHINRGLDRRSVLWDSPWLGLGWQNFCHIHAGVHQEENTRIWAFCPRLQAEMPPLARIQKVWFQCTSPPPTQWYAKAGCKQD